MPLVVKIIMNAGSGADDKQEIHQQLIELFAANEIEAGFLLAKNGTELVELAKQAAHDDSEIIVAAGGDGTVSAVVAALVGTNKTLGVLPLGTLNHFAKDLGIPLELAAAVSVIAANQTVKIDIGKVNERVFINNSSIGLYPNIVRRRERQQRLGRSKWFAAFWATVAVLRRYPFFAVKLTTEREQLTRLTPFVFVGNNEYQMDFLNVGARKCLDAGKLSVYVLNRTGRTGLIKLALRSVFGRLREAEDFEAFCVAEITIDTRRKKRLVLVAFDGEVERMQAPLNYQILPQSLRVIVPQQKATE